MSLISTNRKETNVVELEIAIDAQALKEATDRVFKRKVKTITVPGFRKGKAPRQLIEKMYGEGVFLEDAINDLYPQIYSEAVEEAGIEPVNQAQVELLTMDKETGGSFKATVTVKPEVEIKDYKGLEAEKHLDEVTDEDIAEELGRRQDRNARIITVEGRAAQDGDTAVVDFDGYVDDVPFDGGKGEAYELVLGSHSFIGTFEEQIVGHSVGDAFDVAVTFPEEYHVEELKGKPAVFKVKLGELKCKEVPELDDEFAKDVSEFDTLEELRADIRREMIEHREKHANEDFENTLASKLAEKLEGEIPECMYESRTDEMVQEFEQRLGSQGLQLDLYLQYTGGDMETMRKGMREQAENQVKVRLALEKIANLEDIQIAEADIDAEYAKMAEQYKLEVENIKAVVKEKEIVMDLRCNRALDIVRESAVVIEGKAEEKPAAGEGDAPPEAAKKPAAKKPRAKRAAAKKEEAGGEEK